MATAMKSFRLSRESISEFSESWPILLAGAAITLGLLYLGWFKPFWRIFLVLFAGAYFGCVLRGRFHRRLAAQYPNARFVPVLSIGLLVFTGGVICRMALPAIQGGSFDIVWLAVSFVCILAFVILNRHDPDVVQ